MILDRPGPQVLLTSLPCHTSRWGHSKHHGSMIRFDRTFELQEWRSVLIAKKKEVAAMAPRELLLAPSSPGRRMPSPLRSHSRSAAASPGSARTQSLIRSPPPPSWAAQQQLLSTSGSTPPSLLRSSVSGKRWPQGELCLPLSPPLA